MALKGPKEIATYEIDMHENLTEGRPSRWAIGNALTESRVLHARQLCDIFYLAVKGMTLSSRI
jgi:hypothetical protein